MCVRRGWASARAMGPRASGRGGGGVYHEEKQRDKREHCPLHESVSPLLRPTHQMMRREPFG